MMPQPLIRHLNFLLLLAVGCTHGHRENLCAGDTWAHKTHSPSISSTPRLKQPNSLQHFSSKRSRYKSIPTWKKLAQGAFWATLGYRSLLGTPTSNAFTTISHYENDELLYADAIESENGNFLQISTYFHRSALDFSYGILSKIQPDGVPLWSRVLALHSSCPDGNITLRAVTESSDGYIVVGGTIVRYNGNGDIDILLASFTSTGELQAIKKGGQNYDNNVCDLTADELGTVWAVGASDQGNLGNDNAYIARFQASDLSMLFRRQKTIYSSSCDNMAINYQRDRRVHAFLKYDGFSFLGLFGMYIIEIQPNNSGNNYLIKYSFITHSSGLTNFIIRDSFYDPLEDTIYVVGDSDSTGVMLTFDQVSSSFKWQLHKRLTNSFPIQLHQLTKVNGTLLNWLFSGEAPSETASDSAEALHLMFNQTWGLTWGNKLNISTQNSLKSSIVGHSQLYAYGTTGDDSFIISSSKAGVISNLYQCTAATSIDPIAFYDAGQDYFASMRATQLGEPGINFEDISDEVGVFELMTSSVYKCTNGTKVPTLYPITTPTNNPSASPIHAPTQSPTLIPLQAPTVSPSHAPSHSPFPDSTFYPSGSPSFNPSHAPTLSPFFAPSLHPTQQPSRSPSRNPSYTPTLGPSGSPTLPPSHAPSAAPVDSPSISPTHVPTHTPTTAPSPKPTTLSPTPKPTPLFPFLAPPPTVPPSPIPSTLAPSPVPTQVPSSVPSRNPSSSPSNFPTSTPSFAPSQQPTLAPSFAPSQQPSLAPTQNPSSNPSKLPSNMPTSAPSFEPSHSPTLSPSLAPSVAPSQNPTLSPSLSPSSTPSNTPSSLPSNAPTNTPSLSPSHVPSRQPSLAPYHSPSQFPSASPTLSPSFTPSQFPTFAPSGMPSQTPSQAPILTPSSSPSQPPSKVPSSTPSLIPSNAPTNSPSLNPSHPPSRQPSLAPTLAPSSSPSNLPSSVPSHSPSLPPSYAPTGSPSLPIAAPTSSPSLAPSINPSISPSNIPSTAPSRYPTKTPSNAPTYFPSTIPSNVPSNVPTTSPSYQPTTSPSTNFSSTLFNATPAISTTEIQKTPTPPDQVDFPLSFSIKRLDCCLLLWLFYLGAWMIHLIQRYCHNNNYQLANLG